MSTTTIAGYTLEEWEQLDEEIWNAGWNPIVLQRNEVRASTVIKRLLAALREDG